ncbi:inner membrane-spanning protein YciB [Allosphingosinicella deserti]|uniref:Inner membrane-spanning protein YciB n=1 Tax=Allosphingosinicella deserti TaxID=2116704 RepID=A0A2P7QNA2_9SPHN|nr:inner membrane-spanning protein YciB [Sphingomonas deserti]PSJ39424.1 intracellular septation protein A [Sphingomonas deserti]
MTGSEGSNVPEPISKASRPESSAGVRLLTDLGPLAVFFIVNLTLGIFAATGAFMIAIVAAIAVSLFRYRHVSPLLWFSAAMVLVLGGATLWFHSEVFIKIKPTIYYLIVASLLAFGLVTGRNLLKMVLGTAYPGLSERGWQLLSRNWAVFFLVMAIANELVWRNSSTTFWAGFKLWGFIPATFLFAAANVPMLVRHGLQLGDDKDDPPVPPTQ